MMMDRLKWLVVKLVMVGVRKLLISLLRFMIRLRVVVMMLCEMVFVGMVVMNRVK